MQHNVCCTFIGITTEHIYKYHRKFVYCFCYTFDWMKNLSKSPYFLDFFFFFEKKKKKKTGYTGRIYRDFLGEDNYFVLFLLDLIGLSNVSSLFFVV